MATFTGIPFGSVQSQYFDQNATALAGDLFSPSDINLCDSAMVDQEGGVVCGRFVDSTTVAANRSGIGNMAIKALSAATTATTLYGVLVRSQATQSDANGKAFVDDNRMGNVLRKDRVGGRIWVETTGTGSFSEASTAYVVISNTVAGNTAALGALTFAAISGDSKTDTVDVSSFVKVRSAGTAGSDLALVEFVM